MNQKRKEFEELLVKVIDLKGISWISRTFAISKPSIFRWLKGLNSPHEAMLDWHIKELQKALDESILKGIENE